MKKKLLMLMLCASMMLSMSACGATKTEEKSQAETSSANDSASGDEETSETSEASDSDLNDVTYKYTVYEDDGNASINGYEEYEMCTDDISEYKGVTGRVLTIPSEEEGFAVTEIRGFTADYSITKVIIPDTVTEIGDEAFELCQNLTEVEIGNNVTKIGARAFHCCEKLESVYIPASVTEIGGDALRANANITFYGEAGSYVETYCQEEGLNFVAQ